MENIIKEMFLVTIEHGCNKLRLLLRKEEFENLQPTDYKASVLYNDCKFVNGKWIAKNNRGNIVEIIQGVGEISARIAGV